MKIAPSSSPGIAGAARGARCYSGMMPRTWLVDTAPRHQALPANAVAMLLNASDDTAPAARMLDFVNEVVPVDFLSLVSHTSMAQSPGPRLVEGHCHAQGALPGDRNVTADCFAIYRQRYWRSDQATRIAEHLQSEPSGVSPVTALHCLPEDIPVAGWRNEIYDREQLSGRLTFLYAPRPRQVYSINLYRRAPPGPFRSGEVQRLLAVAPLLRQVHRQVLAGRPLTASLPESLPESPGAAAAEAEQVLARVARNLSPRELQVCARIALGISADGIAADLGIASSTVLTLRKRAYAKLADAGVVGGRWRLMHLAGLRR